MRKLALLIALGAIGMAACKKDYYEDSGLQRGVYDMSGYDWLKTNPMYFDSLVTIIRLAGLENVVKDSTITFFAPTDKAIKEAMDIVHEWRYNEFKDTLKLEEVPAEVWRKYLSRYIFKEKYLLKDIPRLAPSLPDLFPGMNMESWEGYILNLGVLYSDYNGTKDVGPRTVVICDIGSLDNPFYEVNRVATSDLQPRNCVIHILNSDHSFGFSKFRFLNTVEEYIP